MLGILLNSNLKTEAIEEPSKCRKSDSDAIAIAFSPVNPCKKFLFI
jgi:hypothetical protein